MDVSVLRELRKNFRISTEGAVVIQVGGRTADKVAREIIEVVSSCCGV